MHPDNFEQRNSCCSTYWHTSCWNETKSTRLWAPKPRKRRKKRDKPVSVEFHHHSYCTSRQRHPVVCQIINLPVLPSLPRMKFLLIFMIMPMILSSLPHHFDDKFFLPWPAIQVNGQLVVEHPKNRDYKSHPITQGSLLNSRETTGSNSRKSLAERNRLQFREQIANYSTMPSSEIKQNELLRRLSSTMLLETLLRHPLPSNKAPFPPLPLPTNSARAENFEHRPNKNINNDNDSRQKQVRIKTKGRSAIEQRIRLRQQQHQRSETTGMDVSTTNLTSVTDSTFMLENTPENKIPGSWKKTSPPRPEAFNASSLNYLVEKLLSAGPQKGPTLLDKIQSPKHQSVQKAPYEVVSANNILPQNQELDQTLDLIPVPDANVTLDMLIKDEYDSRVEPMIKSLVDQQKLSTSSYVGGKNRDVTNTIQDTTTSVGPTNHKLDEMPVASTSGSSLHDSTTTIPEYLKGMPPPTTTSPITIITVDPNSHNTLVAFEDTEDSSEGSNEDDNDNESPREAEKPVKNNTSAIKEKNTIMSNNINTKKILLSVPPYQLSNNFQVYQEKLNQSRFKMPETQVSTSATNEPVTTESSFSPRTDSISKELRSGDKATGASARGSLVFSDGADEPIERANKKKGNKNRVDLSLGFGSRYSSSAQKKKKKKDSSVIPENSNVNQTNDGKMGESFLLHQLLSTINPLIHLKLDEQPKSKVASYSADQNPLIYKGYVGKDDYLLSSSARDWSRPINNRDTFATPKYLYNFPTTPAPPITSTVPYNYFLNHPVTNAQSVPSMVIPTSDPLEVTTRIPMTTRSDVAGVTYEYHHHHHPKPAAQFPMNSYVIRQQQIPRSSLLPIDRTLNNNPHHRKYSYQIPDWRNKTQPYNKYPNMSSMSLSNLNSSASETAGESEISGRREINAPVSTSIPKLSIESERNWSPTKGFQYKNSQANQKRRQQVQDFETPAPSLDKSPMNSSSLISVPFAGLRGMTNHSQFKTSPSEAPTLTDPNSLPSIVAGTPQVKLISGHSAHDYVSHQHHIVANHSREKSVNSNSNKTPYEAMSEQAMQGYQDKNDGESTDNSARLDQIRGKKRPKDQVRGGDQKVDMIEENRTVTRQNQTRKGTIVINHEPAESEISLTGLDKNQYNLNDERRNQTSRFTKLKTTTHEPTIVMDGNDSGSYVTSTTTDSVHPTSLGPSIISNTNFFGEASSESPTLDNSIPIMSNEVPVKRKHTAGTTEADPYQRTSSNNIMSTVNNRQTSSTPVPTTTTTITPAPKLQQASSTQPTPKAQDEQFSTSASGPGSAKPAKLSSDRLAFILIGGSCALSVVCLILAAMSMRCQDVCDDYRSLRNAERAALKLQRHRLKYTKNHQINRLNQERTTKDIAHALIDDLNIQNGSSESVGPNHIRGTNCNANKFSQFNEPVHNKNNNMDLWNSTTCQPPFSAYINGKSSGGNNKELQVPCRCTNCFNQRWVCQDDLAAGNKHMSWLYPHYYMQHHSRLRPLFGAGSSVGTFFPRRMDGQSFLSGGGGSTDAQILIDNQPQHTCTIADQRGVMLSKSILHKNKKTHARHLNGVETAFDIQPNFECSNFDHNHAHHFCQNHHHHHHHNHKCNPIEAPASDEGDSTPDDSVHRDKCSSQRDNNNRLVHLRANGGHNNHQATGWKPGSVLKTMESHGNNNSHTHHHHQQQQFSSSDRSSVAQCTCSRDQQPLLASDSNGRQQHSHRTSHKHTYKHDQRASNKHQTRAKDKSMLIWSTNRDRLI